MNLPTWIDEALKQGMTLHIRRDRDWWIVSLQQGDDFYEASRAPSTLERALESLDTLMIESANIKISQ